MFDVGPSKVFESIWEIVDAFHQLKVFDLSFPDSHDKQCKITQKFKKKSEADFDCCVGAVDSILVWTNRPSKSCCKSAGCNAGKFFCGRKLKYGLNCQAICNSDGHFLDFSILFLGSTTDFLAFKGTTLHQHLLEGL